MSSRIGPFPGTIVIKHNPVTTWETYNLTLERSISVGQQGFYQFSKEERADEGYKKCTFRMRGQKAFLSEFMRDGLGRDLRVKEPGGRGIWEGMITQLSYSVGPVQWKVGLRDMANSVWVRYRVTGGSSTVRSTALTDTDSQARYGVKEFVLSGGELESSDVADQVAQTYLNTHSWPRPTPVQVTRRQLSPDPNIEVKALGYFSTLNWCVFNQTGTTDAQGSSAQVTEIMADTDIAQFVNSTDIDTNSTSVARVYDTDRRGGDIIKDLARLGDSNNNRWIAYMTDNREFVFKEAAPPRVLA